MRLTDCSYDPFPDVCLVRRSLWFLSQDATSSVDETENGTPEYEEPETKAVYVAGGVPLEYSMFRRHLNDNVGLLSSFLDDLESHNSLRALY
jgi:hypothetical protein